MRLSGKIALVTGGNSGIGRGIVHRFVKEGARVIFGGRDSRKGESVRAEVERLGAQAFFLAGDLSREPEVQKMIGEIDRRFGRLDILVNNAGLGSRRAEIEKTDPPGRRWDKLRGPNLDAAYFTSAHAMPLLKRSGKGAIVNISSTATLHGNWGLYCVAKAGVEALTRALAAEGAPHGVRANGVSPGWVATKTDEEQPASGTATGEWQLPPSLMNRIGTPGEIAAAVLFLASDDASFVTGQTLIVDGGLSITDYTSLPLLKQLGSKLFSGMA
jgi:NAD(P)-dependent dehydrogenase (short-subunit alcohol dehydrogenase family)